MSLGLEIGGGLVMVPPAVGAGGSGSILRSGVLYVDPTNGDDLTATRGNIARAYATLAAAFDDLQSGDTIYGVAGTHATAPLTLSTSKVSLFFSPGAKIVAASTTSTALLTIKNCSDVEVQGGEWDGQRSAGAQANGGSIAIGAGTSVTSNITILGGRHHSFGQVNGQAIWVQKKSNHVVLQGVRFDDNFCCLLATVGTTVYTDGWYDLEIISCRFTNAWSSDTQSGGIKISTGSTLAYTPGFLVMGCHLDACGSVGIENVGGGINGGRIVNNFVYNSPDAITVNTTENVTIQGNEVYGSDYGIECAGACKNVTIVDNLVDGRNAAGTVVATYCCSVSNTPAPTEIKIRGNRFRYATNSLLAYFGTNGEISGNKFIAGAGVTMVNINSNNHTIFDNDFSRDAGGTGDVILINTTTNTSDSVIIQQNRFRTSSGHITSGRVIDLYGPGTNNITNLIVKGNWADGSLYDQGYLGTSGGGSFVPTYQVIGNLTSYSNPLSTTHSFGGDVYVGITPGGDIGTTVQAWSAILDTLATGDGSVINVPSTNISGLLSRAQTDFTVGTISEAATLTLAHGSTSKVSLDGTHAPYTIAFSGTPVATQPSTILKVIVSNAAYTITIPTSRRVSDVGTTTSVTLPIGNHELSWAYDGASLWLVDSTYDITITPTALSGDVNNYAPTGLATAATVRIDGGAADRNITGLDSTSTADNRVIRILNIGANNITLVNSSSSSTAANRFLLPADTILPPNTALALSYDNTSARWRPWSRALANTGVTAGNYTYSAITVDSAGRITSASSGTDPTTLDAKPSVGYASTSALPANTYANGTSGVGATLTGNSNGPLVIDSVTVAVGGVGQRVLVAGESTSANNGWYSITQVGVIAVSPYILTRTTESDQAAEIGAGYLTSVIAPNTITPGSANNGKVFISVAADPFTVGTTALTFSQVGSTYSAGTGLGLSGTTFSIDTATTVDKTTAQVLTNKDLSSGTNTLPALNGHALYAGASPPTVDVGPFGVFVTGVDLKTAGLTTIFTVPASRTFICTGSEAYVTSVTTGGAGTQNWTIKESSSGRAMTTATASGSGTPVANQTVYVETVTAAGGPFSTCAATNIVQISVATSHAGSTAVSGTVIVRGYYIT